ncbi:hypothetical protein V6N12_025260 [Hibiscus sabdariffa]|uniref:Uncharacterized protein n=1 Tax=Hibiscus sabdariffa TaxID=183260 RepID=A0ABR2BLZ8_9ROSI
MHFKICKETAFYPCWITHDLSFYVGYILGDTTEHCSTFKGTRTRAAFVFVIGFLMLDLANNTVQVLISTNLVMLYFAYGWLLETSWDFQLVLVGVDIDDLHTDGFLSWKVELVVKPVLILKQHFLWQLLTSHLCSLSVITMSENYNGKDQSLWHYSRRTDRFSVLCNKEAAAPALGPIPLPSDSSSLLLLKQPFFFLT